MYQLHIFLYLYEAILLFIIIMAEKYILRKDYIHPKTKNVYYQSTAQVSKEHLSYELLDLLEKDPSYFLVIDTKDPTYQVSQEIVSNSTSVITKKINSSENEIQPTRTVVKTNINTATQEQLKTIPNLTTTQINKIMEMRPFKSFEELSKQIPLSAGKNWDTYPIFLDIDEPKS